MPPKRKADDAVQPAAQRQRVAPAPPKDRILGRFKDKHILEHNGRGGKKALLEHSLETAHKRERVNDPRNPLYPPTRVSTTHAMTTDQKKHLKKELKTGETQRSLTHGHNISIATGMKRSATANAITGRLTIEKHRPTDTLKVGATDYTRRNPYINKTGESMTPVGHRVSHSRGSKLETYSPQEWKDYYAAKGKPLKSPPY